MANRIMIYGGGGLGREVLQILRDRAAAGDAVECAGFVVDAAFDPPGRIKGFPVIRDIEELRRDPSASIVVAIGDPAARARIVASIERKIGPRFASAIHPEVCCGTDVSIGAGAIILGHSSITTDCRLGSHVLVNPGCTIAHDDTIGDFAALSPGVHLGGGVRIEAGCMLGIGALVLPRVAIGHWSVVGAGAVVLADVPCNSTVVGVPARITSSRPEGWHSEPNDPP